MSPCFATTATTQLTRRANFSWHRAIQPLFLGFHLIMAAEHNHGPTGTYTDWTWPEPPPNSDGKVGYVNVEHSVTPEIEADGQVGYFWSHQVAFNDGEAGYFGLQTLGKRPDGSKGKVAIFSIWNALGARGPGFRLAAREWGSKP